VQDGPSLRVVQRRRPVARAQQERGENRGGDQLESKSPADRAATHNHNTHNIYVCMGAVII